MVQIALMTKLVQLIQKTKLVWWNNLTESTAPSTSNDLIGLNGTNCPNDCTSSTDPNNQTGLNDWLNEEEQNNVQKLHDTYNHYMH